ncbi:hypothetical protein E8E11_003669 [Didymella keratinophila]|nr:hypothetical protein E8E11_003669 [Didymella keratinophila]
MAIASAIPGFEVTVEVDNVPLPEYQYEDDGTIQDDEDGDTDPRPEAVTNSAVKYIEVPSGAQFSIRWMLKEPFDSAIPVEALINIDGSYVNCQMREAGDKDGDRGYKCVSCIHTERGQDYVQNFRFAELEIDEESHQMSNDLKRQLEGEGTITVYFSYLLGEVEVHAPEIPQLSLTPLDALNEKISQKAAPTPGDVLTHQASWRVPYD